MMVFYSFFYFPSSRLFVLPREPVLLTGLILRNAPGRKRNKEARLVGIPLYHFDFLVALQTLSMLYIVSP